MYCELGCMSGFGGYTVRVSRGLWWAEYKMESGNGHMFIACHTRQKILDYHRFSRPSDALAGKLDEMEGYRKELSYCWPQLDGTY